MIGSSERAGLTRQLAAAVAWQMLQSRHAPGDQNRCVGMPPEIKTDARLFASDCYMTDTYELAEIAARGCPPSIIDEPTPEQTPWRRRSIRLHEDAPRRTRPDVLISHAHESPAGLYRPRPSSYVSALFRLDALPSLGEREAGIQPARATSGTSPCSRSVKQNGSRVTLPPSPVGR